LFIHAWFSVSQTGEAAKTKMDVETQWRHTSSDKKGKDEGKSTDDPFSYTVYLRSKNILTAESEELELTSLLQRKSVFFCESTNLLLSLSFSLRASLHAKLIF